VSEVKVREVTQKDIGKHVIWVDATGKAHDALINAVHGPNCINLVIVLDDENQYDSYGRKVYKGNTSVMHGSIQQAHGWYWLWPGEERVKPNYPDTAKE
jgi:ribosomal protein L35AE/L33A